MVSDVQPMVAWFHARGQKASSQWSKHLPEEVLYLMVDRRERDRDRDRDRERESF
jgi:hypothetical protein